MRDRAGSGGTAGARGEDFPEELMIQAAPLEMLARAQALGGDFYGVAVLPPWKRPGWEIPADAREALDLGAGAGAGSGAAGAHLLAGGGVGLGAGGVPLPGGVPRYNWTDKDDRAIYQMRTELHMSFKMIAEKLGKGTTTTLRSRFMNHLQDRSFMKPKKKYQKKQVVHAGGVQKAPAAAVPIHSPVGEAAPVGEVPTAAVPGEPVVTDPISAPERIPNSELARGLYNKVVYLDGGHRDDKGRLQLYFVLVFDSDRRRANLVEMYQKGFFGRKSSRANKPRFALKPEGEGEELLDVEATRCTIVRSEAVYKMADADQEAWELLEEPWASERRPDP